MKKESKMKPWLKLVITILICEATGIVSGLIGSAYNNEWFEQLNKPTWNPPGYLFAPVWTTLYLLMGISLWLIWKNKAAEINKRNAYVLFAAQLFLNFWWSIIFFRFHSPLIALIDIVAMVILVILTAIQFSRFSKPAAWLLVPYIAWISFATALNYSMYVLNK